MLPAADVDADSDARRPLQTVYVHGLRVASLGSSVISEIIVSTAVVLFIDVAEIAVPFSMQSSVQ
jgi:hypothetical protein